MDTTNLRTATIGAKPRVGLYEAVDCLTPVPRLIVLGSPGSGRSTFAYEMSGQEPVKSRFDSYSVASTVDDAVRMTMGSESTIVLLVDYPRFRQDSRYRADSLGKADGLRKKGLKFVVVANKINDAKEPPSSAKETLSKDFATKEAYVYDSAQPAVFRLPGPSGEVARQAVLAASQFKEVKSFGLSDVHLDWFTRAGQTKQDLDKEKAGISSAIASPDNSNSMVEVTAPGGWGIKASGPVAYPFIVIVSFALVFLTLNQLLPNVKDLFTQVVFVLAAAIGLVLLAFVWVQSSRLIKKLGSGG